MSNFTQGLLISVLGIGVTFVALGTLILIINILQWLFPPKKDLLISKVSKEEKDEEIAAAIGAAIALLDDKKKFGADLGQLLQRRGWRNTSEDKNNLSKG